MLANLRRIGNGRCGGFKNCHAILADPFVHIQSLEGDGQLITEVLKSAAVFLEHFKIGKFFAGIEGFPLPFHDLPFQFLYLKRTEQFMCVIDK